jgi:hypothetical protein
MWQLRIVKNLPLALCLAGLIFVPACTEDLLAWISPDAKTAPDNPAVAASLPSPPIRVAETQTRAHLTQASYVEPALRPSILSSTETASGVRVASVAPVEKIAPPAQIQLGAYRDEATAAKDWMQLVARAPTLLGGLTPQIVVADLPQKGRFYRLRTDVSARAAADALCAALKSRGIDCLPVKG